MSPVRSEWIEKARKTEDLGYDTLVVGDHTIIPMTPFLAMLAAVEATKHLRVGAHVLANDFYNPVRLAMDVATLDVLSEGRFELGLGTGWYINDYRSTGIPFETPGTRVSRMEEAVQILKSAFSGDAFSFQGKFYKVENFKLPILPVQRPHPPLLIGGGGKRVLSFAAREADIVSVNVLTTREGWIDGSTTTEKATAEKVGWVNQAAGSRTDLELSIDFSTIRITNSRGEKETAVADLRRDWEIPETMVSQEDLLATPGNLIGSEDELVEKILRLREQFGFSYLVFWEPIEAGARLIKRLKT
jgi:probable F420-dependent oxidoreductase